MPFISSRIATSIAAALIAAALSTPLGAQERDFQVPAQDASSGVREFAKQAGIQVMIPGDAARGRTVNEVSGNLPLRDALDRLIDGTGLSIRSYDQNLVVLEAAAAPRRQGARDIAEEISTMTNVVVTGSRIPRPELESAMPIGVIDMETARSLGKTTAYEALIRDTAVAPGNVGPYYSAAEGQYDGGMAAVNLRNLGTARSLTLIDGRRRVSGAAKSSAVDINMIPSAMIERIEIITGGAAALYGADAVTGAANVITKKDFEGFEISGTTGISQRGDGRKTELSVVAGSTFADNRGSITLGGTYVKNDPVHLYDRSYASNRVEFRANPENGTTDDGIPDNIVYYQVGNLYLSPYPNITIGNDTWLLMEDGSARLGRFDTRFSNGELSIGDGGDAYSLYADNFLVTPIENTSFIGRFDYSLTDWLDYGLRVDYGRSKYDVYRHLYREDSRTTWMNGARGAVAHLDNPYLPDSFREIMAANGLDQIHLNRSYGNLGPLGDSSDRTSTTISNTLSGTLPRGFRWEAFWQYGRSTNDITASNVPIASRWVSARDVVADPVTGAPVCRDETAREAGCVPLDIFSFDPLTPEQRAYMVGTRYKRRENRQMMWGGNIYGSLFNLPAGPVEAVLGFEKRKEKVNNTDDPLASPDYGNELSHTASWAPYEPALKASMDVSEVFGELMVPIARDLPGMRRLDAEGAFRRSSYSTFDSGNTWKYGIRWAPVEGLTVRAVKSKSVRVPNFGELYAPRATGPFNPSDPCEAPRYNQNPARSANCAALGIATPLPDQVDTAVSITGGDVNLSPETSDSRSIGVVWQPGFLKGLDLTADYWEINISDIITNLSVGNIMNLCVDLPSIDNPFCGRVTRGADGYVVQVDRSTINASVQHAEGVDIGASYRFALGDGNMRMGLRGSFLLKQEITTLPGFESSMVKQDGGYQNPRFRGTLFTSYDIGDWNFGLDTRFRSSARFNANSKYGEQYDSNHIQHRVYNDVTVGWFANEALTLRAGINNIFDVKPPFRPGAYQGAGGNYDIYGRYLFLNATLRF